jgi:hypothetical protein
MSAHAPAAPAVLQGLLVYDEIFEGRFTSTLKAAGGTHCSYMDNAIIQHPKSGSSTLVQHSLWTLHWWETLGGHHPCMHHVASA